MDKYQSLEAWKHAHAALLLVLRATDEAYHPRSKALFDQIKRATVSVEANVVEGYALGSTAYFRKHLRIAFGSAAEAECLIRAAFELHYLTRAVTAPMLDALGGAMRTIRGLLAKPLAIPAPSRTTPHSPLPKKP